MDIHSPQRANGGMTASSLLLSTTGSNRLPDAPSTHLFGSFAGSSLRWVSHFSLAAISGCGRQARRAPLCASHEASSGNVRFAVR